MRTVEINVYRFDELSEKAKALAMVKYGSEPYFWLPEAMESLRAFAKALGGKLVQYEIDLSHPSQCSATVTWLPGCSSAMEYVDAMPPAVGNCPWTGYCADDDCVEGAKKAVADGVSDLNGVFQAGFGIWLKNAAADAAHQWSEEGFSEQADANCYEFVEDGNMYRV